MFNSVTFASDVCHIALYFGKALSSKFRCTMITRGLVAFFFTAASFRLCCSAKCSTEEAQQFADYLDSLNFSKSLIPLKRNQSSLKIHTSVFINSIVEVNTNHQTVKVSLTLSLNWWDYRIKWNSGMLCSLWHPGEKIWRPRWNLLQKGAATVSMYSSESDIEIRNNVSKLLIIPIFCTNVLKYGTLSAYVEQYMYCTVKAVLKLNT